MSRLQWRHADPSSKIPPYLQNRTVENLKWQLKLLSIFVAYQGVRYLVEEHQWRKKYGKTPFYKKPFWK